MIEIKIWVLNIATMSVLMVLLDLLMPEGKMRKLTQLVSGFVIMFVMINPALQLLNKGVTVTYAGWEDEVYLLNSSFKYSTETLKADQKEQVLALYRSMLISDLRNRLESHKQISKAEVDVVLNENDTSDNYGEIRKLYINLLIDKNNEYHSKNNENLLDEMRKELKQALSLDEEEIIINIKQVD